MKKIERLQKYTNGGEILKLQSGGSPYHYDEERAQDPTQPDYWMKQGMLPKQAMFKARSIQSEQYDMENPELLTTGKQYLPQTKKIADTSGLSFNNETNKVEGDVEIKKEQVDPEEFFQGDTTEQPSKPVRRASISGQAGAFGSMGANLAVQAINAVDGAAMGANLAVQAINAVDGAAMGDKNFSASSQAIDTAVHGIFSTLMKHGNPYAMAAGVALEGLNFITKAAGKNVQGYDVNINNSGYGNLGHMESEAGRVWDSWSGATARKLRKRNEQARMALAASEISEDISYEQESRTNSVTNVLQQNQIALAGGIDSSLLGN